MMGKEELGALPNKKPTLTAIGTLKSPSLRDFPQKGVNDELKLSKPQSQFHFGFWPSSRISIKGEALGMDKEDAEEDPEEDPKEEPEEDSEEDPEEDSEENPEEDPEEDYEPDSPFYYGKKEFEHFSISERNEAEDCAVVEDKNKYGSFHVKDACDADDIKNVDVPNEIWIEEQDDKPADDKREKRMANNNEHFFVLLEEKHRKKNQKSEVFVGGLENALVEAQKKNGSFHPEDACDTENMKYVDVANEIGIEEEDDKEKDEMVDNDNEHFFADLEARHGKKNQKSKVYVGGLGNAVVEDEKKCGSLHAEDAHSVVEEDMKYVGVVDETGIDVEAKCADVKQVGIVNRNNEHCFVVLENRHKEKNQETQVLVGSLDGNAEGNFVGGDKYGCLPADDAGDVVDEDLEYVSKGTEIDQEDNDDPEDDEEDEMVNTDDWDYHAALKDRNKVFIGGLDVRTTEGDIKKVFSRVGEITGISLLTNSLTHKRKGFAILTFATSEQAKHSITKIRNPVVNGKLLSVSLYKDRNTLFLGNICKGWTKAILENRLKHFGVEKLENLKLMEDLKNAGMNRGFAFLCFSSYPDAMIAYKRLQMRDVDLGADRSAKVAFALPFTEPWDRQKVRGKSSQPVQNGTWKHVLRGNYPLRRKHGSISIRAGSIMHQKIEKRPYTELYAGSRRSEEYGGKQAFMAKSDKTLSHHKNHRSYYHRHDELDEFALRDRLSEKYDYCRRDELDKLALRDRPEKYDYYRHAELNELALRDRPAKKYDPVFKKHRRSRHPPRESGNLVDLYGDASHDQAMSSYVDEGFGQRFGRRTSSHHIEHPHDNDPFHMKRRYSELDDVPSNAPVRVPRPRLDHESSAEVSHHGHAYSNRVERFNPKYASSNSTHHLGQRTCECCCCHQDMGDIRDSVGDVDYYEMHSPSFVDDYPSENCFRHQDMGLSRGSVRDVDYDELHPLSYSNVYPSAVANRSYSSSLRSSRHLSAHFTYHEDFGFE